MLCNLEKTAVLISQNFAKTPLHWLFTADHESFYSIYKQQAHTLSVCNDKTALARVLSHKNGVTNLLVRFKEPFCNDFLSVALAAPLMLWGRSNCSSALSSKRTDIQRPPHHLPPQHIFTLFDLQRAVPTSHIPPRAGNDSGSNFRIKKKTKQTNIILTNLRVYWFTEFQGFIDEHTNFC